MTCGFGGDGSKSFGRYFYNQHRSLRELNLYELKADVYLNGGPPPNAPCTAAGLPNGIYYVQVTDPSGGTLLHEASDLIADRRVEVSRWCYRHLFWA
jgi:hypothetical protein